MTVKELKEVLKTIENEDMEVVDHYNDSVNGYYFRTEGQKEELVFTRYYVQPRNVS